MPRSPADYPPEVRTKLNRLRTVTQTTEQGLESRQALILELRKEHEVEVALIAEMAGVTVNRIWQILSPRPRGKATQAR